MKAYRIKAGGFFGILALFLSVGCLAQGKNSMHQSLAFETIDQGGSSGARTGQDIVVRNETEWRSIWRNHKSGSPPAVDFSKKMVIAVFLGERPTGGYSVTVTEISRAESADGGLKISVEEVRPGRRCIVPMMITHPYHIVQVGRSEGPVVFDHTIRTKDCSDR